VPVILNTDDPDMFHTDLGTEYRIARDVFHFNQSELRELAQNSFRACFLPDDRKAELLASF
jgi:aminodeoxyfutalosine deaminase